jgi:hypothetical protein
VEVKTPTRTPRATGAQWERATRRGWAPLPANPATQATRNARQVRDFLQRSGVHVDWVEAAVALAAPPPIGNFPTADPPV